MGLVGTGHPLIPGTFTEHPQYTQYGPRLRNAAMNEVLPSLGFCSSRAI